MRMYWVYGPDQKDITIIGLEPHPEDKKNGAYDRISLSDLQNKTEYGTKTRAVASIKKIIYRKTVDGLFLQKIKKLKFR